jgi:hypothetical protein
MDGCGLDAKGELMKTKRNVDERRLTMWRHWWAKMLALVPPPCRHRMRGSDRDASSMVIPVPGEAL